MLLGVWPFFVDYTTFCPEKREVFNYFCIFAEHSVNPLL